ncbi:nitroreductase family protein [Aliikangiella maris]|uniref:Nitroreductase n=2 Tax=Aliikangiella maris TaxID=3162458 RepID=A0ABV2BP99_9GAMM
MDALEQLLSRKSHNKLVEPAPNKQQLEILFKAALRAPDHALLKPWRYRVYQGSALNRLGEMMLKASLNAEPELSEDKQQRILAKPQRAPMVIVASVGIKEHPNVPEIEQILSGGASVQNLLMAAHFQNIGAIWRTGDWTFDPYFAGLLGLEDNEKIVGFIYLGSEEGTKQPVQWVEQSNHVTFE